MAMSEVRSLLRGTVTCLPLLCMGVYAQEVAGADAPRPAPAIAVLRQDWGMPRIGMSVMGTPLTIGAQAYPRGIGTHATSAIEVTLPAGTTRFQAAVGVDAGPDTAGGKGSAVFIVKQGGGVLFASPLLRAGMASVEVDVAINDGDLLRLEVTDGGDGYAYDQANWADARLTVGDETVALDGFPMRDARTTAVSIPPRRAPTTPMPESWAAAVTEGAPRWRRADARQVALGGEWGRRQQITAHALALEDLEATLKRLNHGTPSNMYLGLGKLLDATARLAARPDADQETRDLHTRLVTATLAAQAPNGYIGGWPTGGLLAKSGQWEVHELTYLIVGLLADYRLHGREESRTAAIRAGEYLIGHLRPLREHCAQGLIGLDACLVALDQTTGDPRWRRFLRDHVAPARWVPADRAPHGHVYEHLAVCVGQMDDCLGHPDPERLRHGWRVLEHLGPGRGMLVTGTASHKEHVDTSHRSDVQVETCATAYLIRTLGRIFELTGDTHAQDILERTVHNALFAVQNPDGTVIRYFTRHEGDRGRGDGPYVCCRMNYRRIVAELGEYVAYTGREGIAVCQYVPAQLTLPLDGGGTVALTIDTAYPEDGTVRLRVRPDRPRRFAVRLRLPRWCPNPRATVADGAPLADLRPGGWAVIEREWTGEEAIHLDLPMAFRWIAGRGAQDGRRALVRGPLVYHLAPSLCEPAGLAPEALGVEGADAPAFVRDDRLRPEGGVAVVTGATVGGANPARLVCVPYADPRGRTLWFTGEGVPDELVAPPGEAPVVSGVAAGAPTAAAHAE